MSSTRYEEIVRKCYYDILNRIPDQHGLEHFVHLLEKNKIDEKKLIESLKESPEYKFSYPLEVDPSIPIDLRMKKEWDERAKLDPLFAIATGFSETEKVFWDSGKEHFKIILGLETPRFKKIIQNKEPSKMKILEIGCGIGRVLIPMCDYFGECIGIDVSPEMVQQSQKYIENLPNCKILENNGTDLSMFADNSFDFCFCYIVFQHIPEKKIVEQYIKEVSRVLKSNCLFRFQVRGIVDRKSKEITTWDGVQFSSNEIHEIANKNNFKIIEESDDKSEYYWLTFLSVK